MDKIVYKVIDIKGDYAILLDNNNIENTVAMALLPINICVDDVVEYENLTYYIK